jgi:hypothetical protein
MKINTKPVKAIFLRKPISRPPLNFAWIYETISSLRQHQIFISLIIDEAVLKNEDTKHR